MNEINDSWPRCLLLVQALEVGCVKQTGKEFAAWAAFLSPHAALATIFCFFVVASEIGAHHKTHCFLNLAVRYNFSRRASLPDRRWKDGDHYYAWPISLIFSNILKVVDFQLWPNIAYSLNNFEVKDHECTVMNKPMFEPWKKLFWQAHLQQLSSIWIAPVILLPHLY